jgi:galactokinase
LAADGVDVPAARIEIEADLPRGAGLSSSAALEVAVALALLALAGSESSDPDWLARLCSRVENDWVGARTGLLDQTASLRGRAGHALAIDFATADVQEIPLALSGWKLVVLDSGEAHSHATGAYNERRLECARAAELLGVRHLAAADPVAAAALPEPLARRARHVIEEDARVGEAVEVLRADELGRLGPLLDASHASLRDLFEASADAVEETVGRLRDAGAAGARMIGGGFGGSVLALFPPGAEPPDGVTHLVPAAGARLIG